MLVVNMMERCGREERARRSGFGEFPREGRDSFFGAPIVAASLMNNFNRFRQSHLGV